MGTINTWQLTQDEMESWMDSTKVSIIHSLVTEGLMDWEEADEWAATHSIVLRKKNIFRTLSDTWKKQEEVDGYYILVVKLPEQVEDDDDEDGEKEPKPENELHEPMEDGGKVIELKKEA